MDGLECSEIRLKDVDKSLLRLEAEYYQKKYLLMEQKIKCYDTLCEYSSKIECGPFGSNLLDTEYKENGILVVRPFNLMNYTIEQDNLVFISEETLSKNNLKTYERGTLLFSRVGDIKIGVSNRDKITISPNIVAACLDDKNISKYLVAFFNTKYGFFQIQRQLKVSAQPTISTGIVSELRVPLFENLINIIAQNLDLSEELFQKSVTKYSEAEQFLLSELDMTDFTPSSEGIAVKSFTGSFGISGRLDAEYYQPKYDYLMESLSHFENEALGKLVTTTKSIEPGSECYGDEGVPFVRVSDLSKTGLEDPTIKIPHDIVKNIEELYPKKNTILLSKDGSVGIAYKVEEDMQCVTSGAILHLTVIDTNKILPDYLTLVLNSPVVQMQSERDAGGSILQHWKPSEIEKVVIPIFDNPIQKEISENVQQSFTLRHKSEQLLENAKNAVEMAIEQGEEKAIQWLKEKGVEC